MSERPILFSGPMVRAILDGRKTQTRRVVSDSTSQGNIRASDLLLDDVRTFADPGPSPAGNCGPYLHAYVNAPKREARMGWAEGDCDPGIMERLYPRYAVGDRLWVRESHALVPRTAYAHSDGVQQTLNPSDDHDAAIYREGWERSQGGLRWRPSIHMPRWASRITLEVAGVRVERVQEIDETDAIAEGPDLSKMTELDIELMRGTEEGELAALLGVGSGPTPRFAYQMLWDELNAKRGYGWDVNSWVWVIEFKRVESVKAAS